MIFLVLENAAKKVLVPSGDIGTDWRGGNEPFDDSLWTAGTGGVGYDTDNDPTPNYHSFIGIDVYAPMYNVNGSCYIRIPFTIASGVLAKIADLTLKMRFDDGFVVYLNGTEVKRINCPTTPVWNSLATQSSAEATSAWNTYDMTAHIDLLHEGDNILAIHGLNANRTSSDFLISSELGFTGKTLTVTAGTGGSIVAPAESPLEYVTDSVVEITAEASEGYHFVAWTGDIANVGNSEYADTTITMSDDYKIAATFKRQQFTLTYLAADENGVIIGDAVQLVDYGASGSPVTAHANGDNRFYEWSDDVYDNPRQDTNVTHDITVTAYFGPEFNSLTLDVSTTPAS